MSGRTAKLSEIATLNPKRERGTPPSTPVSFIAMADVDAESGSTSPGKDREYADVAKGYTPFRDGDLLVAKITPCFENGKIAQARLRHSIGAGSTEFHVIRPNEKQVDRRYLLRFLRQEQVRKEGERRMTGSAGQRRVPEAFLANLPIPLPPLDEQRRIAAVLDKVDALRAKRREAIALLDDLTQSVFLDMFGNPSDSWPEVTVEDVAAPAKGSIRTGPFGSQLRHDEFVNDGIAVLGIDNAVSNEFRWGERRYITEEKYKKLSRYTVHPGDVLITIMGTCGRCAVVPDNIPLAINTKHLCCITLDREKCLPDFLHSYFLRHPNAQSYLRKAAKGAIMSGLNMSIIKAMPVKLPPVKLQQEFVDRLSAITSLKEAHRTHLAHLDELFASLQQRAFRGDLFSSEAA